MILFFADIVHSTFKSWTYQQRLLITVEFKGLQMSADIKTQSQALLKNTIADQIAQIVQGIRFGSVEVVIHDGKVVQIERKEKIRFDTK